MQNLGIQNPHNKKVNSGLVISLQRGRDKESILNSIKKNLAARRCNHLEILFEIPGFQKYANYHQQEAQT